MKKLSKKNIIITFVIVLFLALALIDSIEYLKQYNYFYEETANLIDSGYTQLKLPSKIDTFSLFWNSITAGKSSIIQFVYPLILVLVGTLSFHSILQSGFFKNIILRKEYSKYMLKGVLNSWKASLLIPVFIIIVLIASMITTDFNFTPSCAMSMINEECITISNSTRTVDLICKIVNLILFSLSCINIGLIFCKKNNNFILSTIISYIMVIIYQIFVSVILGPLLSKIFNSNFFINGLTMFSFWYYDSSVNALYMFIYGSILFLLTTLILFLTYKKKEDVIINAEK